MKLGKNQARLLQELSQAGGSLPVLTKQMDKARQARVRSAIEALHKKGLIGIDARAKPTRISITADGVKAMSSGKSPAGRSIGGKGKRIDRPTPREGESFYGEGMPTQASIDHIR